MTMTPGTQVRAIAEAAEHQARFLPPTRYRHPGPHLVALLNRISALLDTGTLRALDAQVELDGHGARSVARGWLRAHGLIPEGSAVH